MTPSIKQVEKQNVEKIQSIAMTTNISLKVSSSYLIASITQITWLTSDSVVLQVQSKKIPITRRRSFNEHHWWLMLNDKCHAREIASVDSNHSKQISLPEIQHIHATSTLQKHIEVYNLLLFQLIWYAHGLLTYIHCVLLPISAGKLNDIKI